MIKNKSLFRNLSIFLCLVPMLLLSLFCLVPKRDKINVNAVDEVITDFNFIGANISVPMTILNLDNRSFDRQSLTNITLTFGVKDGVYLAVVYGRVAWPNFDGTDEIYGEARSLHNIEDLVDRSDHLNVYINNSSYGLPLRVYRSGNVINDIIKVDFSHYINTSPDIIRPANYYNTVTYYDSLGNFVKFELPLYSNGQSFASQFLFEERTYYFTSSFNDNAFYNEGYQDGYSNGEQQGYNNGYQSGLDTGSQSGYQDGFSAGVESANNYSFVGLLGAVIDAPVTALTGLLNFEILGFNILAFVTGLITLALIIFIIKLCIGGK